MSKLPLRVRPRLVLFLLATALVAATAQVQGQSITITTLGEIDFTGDFTLNHNFYFSHVPPYYGTFGPMTVQSATGIFASYVTSGDTLRMSTPFMFAGSPPSVPMVWRIGGFMIDATFTNVTGADFGGQNVIGVTNLSGNGFDPSAYGVAPYVGAFSFWDFTAPPYDITNFPSDITGPITVAFDVQYVSHIPDGGATFGFLAISTIGLLYVRRQTQK
jgi:hypothetical protein